MFIACSEAWNNDELPVDAYPNAATALEGADDRELEVEVTAQTPACRVKQRPPRGAKKFIVRGLHHPARPCVLAAPPKIRVQWQLIGVDPRAESGRLSDPLDFSIESVADVAGDANPHRLEDLCRLHAWLGIVDRPYPSAFCACFRLLFGQQQSDAGGGAANRSGDGERPPRSSPGPSQRTPTGADRAKQRGGQHDGTVDPAEVTAGDGATSGPSPLADAPVEVSYITEPHAARQAERNQRMARLRTHRRQVAQIDGHKPPSKKAKGITRPVEPEINPFDHRVDRSDHPAGFRAPDGRIIILASADLERPARRTEIGSQRPEHTPLTRGTERLAKRGRPRPGCWRRPSGRCGHGPP